MRPSLSAIVSYLDRLCESASFPQDQNGVYRPSSRPVARLGLAIEPWNGIDAWVRQQRLDALFLHRPWRLNLSSLPDDVGVLAYHLAFDYTLTYGFNTRLAATLQLKDLVPFAFKEGLPLGMHGVIAQTAFTTIIHELEEIFGVRADLQGDAMETVQRIAFVGAMTDATVREAASQGVHLYVTGQLRRPAEAAVQETGIVVAALGHEAGERWGLRALAGVLRERWAYLEVVVAEGKF